MRKCKKPLFALFLAATIRPLPLSAAAPSGQGEDIFFNEIPNVITASLKRQKLDEVPGAMTVITEADIKAHGLQTFNQVLNLIPGFQSTQAPYGAAMMPLIRGYTATTGHLKLMIDGHAVNGPSHREYDAWQDMPLDDVKQIEIIRGPGSSLYGTDALMAVINVITKKEKGSMASATAGTLGRWGVNAAVASDPERKLRYRASFNQLGEQGGTYHYPTDWFTGTVYQPQSYAPMDKTKPVARFDAGATVGYGDLSLTVRHAESRKTWSEGNLSIMAPGHSHWTARDGFVEAEYRRAFTEQTAWSFKGSYGESYLAQIGQLLPPNFDWSLGFMVPGNFFGPEGAVYKNWQKVQRYSGQSIVETVAGVNSLMAGFEYGYQYIPESQSERNYGQNLFPLATGLTRFVGQDPQNAVLSEHTSEEHWGVFGQDILNLRPVTLILGARYDQYQLAGHAFSPRVAVVWDAPWNQILKASYGQAFLIPSTDQRYYQVSGFVGDPKLRPSVVKTSEISVQNAFATRAHYAVTGFINHMTDAFAFDLTKVPTVSNDAAYRFTGVEVEGRWDALPSLSLWGNYSYVQGKNTRVARSAAISPRNLGNAGVLVKPMEPLSVSVYTHLSGPYGRDAFSGHIPGWGTLNGAVNYDMTKTLSLQLSGQNLLDKETFSYNLIGFFPGSTMTGGNDFPLPGRQVFFKATWRI